MRLSAKEAAAMAARAGRGQNVAADLRTTAGPRVRIPKAPNKGEAAFVWAIQTTAPDLLPLITARDVEIFPPHPSPSGWVPDCRRVDFSLFPIPIAVEIQGRVHLIEEKLQKDCDKANLLQIAGVLLLQFTPVQIEADPASVVATLRAALDVMRGRATPLQNGRSHYRES